MASVNTNTARTDEDNSQTGNARLTSSKSSSSSSDSSSSSSSSATETDTSEEESELDVLCLIDWDDTLFPTSAIDFTVGADISMETHRKLKRVETPLVECLKVLCDLATVVIVTAATEGWIGETSVTLPRLCTILCDEDIQVISAPDQYDSRVRQLRRVAETTRRLEDSTRYANFVGDNQQMRKKKMLVFKEETRKFFNEKKAREETEVVDWDSVRVLVIGDSDDEIDAAHGLATMPGVARRCVRILQLEDRPSIDTMCRQFRRLTEEVESFVEQPSFTSESWREGDQ